MGELHLEIYVERMKREYNVECITGKPQVSYRESITIPSEFDYTHKKQSGGAGQYARIIGDLSPVEGGNKSNVFETHVVGGRIPDKYLSACAKGFDEACERGPLIGHKVLNVKMLINDGAIHSVDSNELAFKVATLTAFRDAFLKAQPVIMEPIMIVSVTSPNEFQGNVIGLLNKLQAVIQETDNGHDEFTLRAECSLSTMFGFASSLRASTQGKGEFSLEFSHYAPTAPHVQKELIAEFQKKQKK